MSIVCLNVVATYYSWCASLKATQQVKVATKIFAGAEGTEAPVHCYATKLYTRSCQPQIFW